MSHRNSRHNNDRNNWNQDNNGQYINQSSSYYNNQQQYPNNQYVSFNQFLNQMQGPPSNSSYSNQYPNYSNHQYNYSNVPSTSNSAQYFENSSSNVNGTSNYDQNAGPSRKLPPFNKDTVIKSNLTATALEFVPKNIQPFHEKPVAPSPIETSNTSSENAPQSSYSTQTHETSNSSRNERNKNSSNEQNGQPKQDGYRNPRRNKDYRNNKGNNNNSGNKDSDEETLTFYNSSMPRTSQDVRNGGQYTDSRNGRSRNWSERPKNNRSSNHNAYFGGNSDRYTNSPKRDKSPVSNQVNPDMTQRERLSEQLDHGQLECLVCCEPVKQTDCVWSCINCFNIQHLRCIRKWATSSIQEGKWRCPACQNTNVEIPTEYRCQCGAVRNPEYIRGVIGAHTCGQSCARPRSCVHPCTLLCHPGPCPPCQATVHKSCSCGAENRTVICSSKQPQLCSRVCNKVLSCTSHVCQQNCHEGPCDECTETIDQVCYCLSACSRTVSCTSSSAGRTQWSCGAECARVLACGAHVCHAVCHDPPCAPCELLPESVTVCPCGQTEIKKGTRKSCTDPIPLCGNLCAKRLPCGPPNDRHFCKTECHEGDCPVCPDQTVVACRCGHTNRVIPCSDLPEMIDNVFCQKKCNKKLSCGRHRCRGTCCVLTSHRCGLSCGRALACGLHRCSDTCHTGHCPMCPNISFDELTCECGLEVILPPVRCGTRPPPCTRDCPRARPCGHAPHHACHSGDCPPCCVLTARSCHGGHEERKTIPCSQEEFSCGMPCGKPLPCGNHTCIKSCHKGPCDTDKCTQPCTAARSPCGHPCGAPCHPGACPAAAPCRRTVTATCPCRRRTAPRACHDAARDRARIVNALAASKMQEGGSVDLSEITRPTNSHVTLECDDECRVEQRTRQMALALQIKNPDISSKLAPRYSDHVRQWASRDPTFAQQIHDKLTDLVHLAKKSKQKTRAHSFPSMNWQKRQFIHELCEHFGCESVAYDAEPNRNVVATADKEKSWLPAMSVLEVLSREAGKRRVPGPVLRNAPSVAAAAANSQPIVSAAKATSGWATLTSTNAWAARSNPPATTAETKPAQPVIDYFDYPPDN